MSRLVRVAVDFTAGIGAEERKRHGIEVLPIHITGLPLEIENRLQRGDLQVLYQFLSSHHGRRINLGTQAGSPWEIKQILELMIQRSNCDIVCLVVSGRLSGLYENTLQATRMLSQIYPNRIVVFGEQAFITLSILARITASYTSEGRNINEVLDFVQDKLGRGFICASVLDLRRLRHSGRVPMPGLLTTVAQPLFRLFRVLPFFILEGEKPRALALVPRRRLERFVLTTIRQRIGFREPCLAQVSWTGAEVLPEAERLQKIIENQAEFVLTQPVLFEPASPIVGVHTGSALVAFGVLGLGYQSISTPVFLRFLKEAQKELEVFQRTVNAINVFPVRDGDTGTNLLSPLTSAGEGIDETLPFAPMLRQVTVRIARKGGGYSGGAIAAYFLGMADYVEKHNPGPELTIPTLVEALQAGTNRCYAYFGSAAKEGTILSVMRACDQAAQKALEMRPTLRNVLSHAYLAATEELLHPRIQEVEILRQARMVDAGGFGFTLILWALLRTVGLARDPKLQERYRLVLKEVRRHAELGQRLIYRQQPPELRGFCVEGCVQGDVAEELKQAFLILDNQLTDAKMTFNVVDGTTHFHIHVSQGLEEEVQRIAARFGYAAPPKRPTPLAKRKREIYRFRFLRVITWLKRVPRHLGAFFANWLAHALFFPITWYRSRRRYQSLKREVERLQLVQQAFEVLTKTDETSILILDAQGRVIFTTDSTWRKMLVEPVGLERLLPADVAGILRNKTEESISQRGHDFDLTVGRYWFDVKVLNGTDSPGFLVRYRRFSEE